MKTKISITVAAIIITLFSSCKVGRFVRYNYANITDHKIFPSRTVEKGDTPFTFPYKDNGYVPDSLTVTANGKTGRISFETYLEDNKTVAFVIIHKDSITYEKYLNKYDEASIINSFSMAKSVLSILVGCALEDGKIKSIEEPITNYLPHLKENGFEKVTINHLLNMTSGIEFNESYINPFGDAASFYYGTNLRKEVRKMKLQREPGTAYRYRSGDSQVLGMVLEAALQGQTISNYLQEKLWKPLGMEFDASWSLDKEKDGVEKTFCCLNARARDFAKIGRLYRDKGVWEGKRIVSEAWVANSTKYDTTQNRSGGYQYQWWIPAKDGSFMAEGILGQFIYVHPKKNLVIVRLGEKTGKTGNWEGIFEGIAAKL
jgi:CubicO group peptidase (beta-lactamase class C family)